MRALLLTTAIVLFASSAFAAGPRGLSAPQPAEPQRPFRQAEVTNLPAPTEQPAATTDAQPQTVQDKLKATGELKPDGVPANPSPVQAQQPVQAPVPQAAPVQAQPAPLAQPQSVQQTREHRTAKKRVARKHESNEREARRIAARFGIYW